MRITVEKFGQNEEVIALDSGRTLLVRFLPEHFTIYGNNWLERKRIDKDCEGEIFVSTTEGRHVFVVTARGEIEVATPKMKKAGRE